MKTKDFAIQQVRTIGLLSDGGTGKTSLAEAMLFDAGEITRLGSVVDGSSTMDYDPEELKRQASISASIGHLEWQKHKVFLVDTPGYPNFLTDTYAALRVIDSAIIVISTDAGVRFQTERVWRWAEQRHLPRLLFLNKMDHDRASFAQNLEALTKAFQEIPVPVQVPVGEGAGFRGVIDLIEGKAYIYSDDSSGKFTVEEVPAEQASLVEEYREKLIERIAESDDTLLEKYLGEGELSEDEVRSGLRKAVLQGMIVPVLLGSATRNIGIQPVLDFIVAALPSPLDRPPVEGKALQGEETVTRNPSPEEPFSALVFKTQSDPYAGKLTIFRVFSGKLSSDSSLYNATKQERERIGQIFFLQGKQQVPVGEIGPGDIAAVAKLKVTTTGDTLTDEKAPLLFAPIEFPNAVISVAIAPKSKGDEEKLSTALARLTEEDPTVRISRDEQTKELIVSGLGELHLEVVMDRLRSKFGVDATMKTPRIPYKETIRTSAKAQGKYKKQTGGRGQYGDAWLEVEPLPRGAGFEFVDRIVGGVIPRQYIPAVEKGVREAMEEGILAGYPVVDVRVTVYDGSYHPVDSSEMAFKIAGSLGFKKAVSEANPVLLEPIVRMEVIVPDECMGDVLGDLNAKRGKVLGVEPIGSGQQMIRALVPLAEVLRYSSNLRSMTAGRGTFSMEFSHYEELPAHLMERVIAESKRESGE
ncbi:MAG: elongation factor G [Nitrospinota bacterium]|nr:MAG: elongation factor G [Nitrospinota bacterium]